MQLFLALVGCGVQRRIIRAKSYLLRWRPRERKQRRRIVLNIDSYVMFSTAWLLPPNPA
jgi:hypothetical protein